MRISDLARPSPERLLKQVQAEESKRWGARLKIFLGYAPGVGKSYRMLDEARRRRERGEDLVVGALQGQQSEEVQAIVRNLEVIPPLETPSGKAVDVESVLRRAPQVCVIDPLAAKNPEGSRNAYRCFFPGIATISPHAPACTQCFGRRFLPASGYLFGLDL